MQTPSRIKTNVQPKTIQKLGNGTYYFNYDINEFIGETSDTEGNIKEETQYDFVQVLIYGQPSYKDVVKAVIRKYISSDEEFDLINSYNSYTQGISEDSSIVDTYKDYLNTLQKIKAKVKESFA